MPLGHHKTNAKSLHRHWSLRVESQARCMLTWLASASFGWVVSTLLQTARMHLATSAISIRSHSLHLHAASVLHVLSWMANCVSRWCSSQSTPISQAVDLGVIAWFLSIYSSVRWCAFISIHPWGICLIARTGNCHPRSREMECRDTLSQDSVTITDCCCPSVLLA